MSVETEITSAIRTENIRFSVEDALFSRLLQALEKVMKT